jgi:hypothetical protein
MTTRKSDLAALRASELSPPPRFRKIPPHKREAKRRKAHDSHCRAERGCAPLRGRARLPAPHRGTHHRLSPRWLCSRTGFPQSAAPAVFCRFAERRPELSTLRADRVFLPVDRGPGAARVRIGNSARGDRIPLRLSGLPFRKGALGERDRDGVTEKETSVKRSHRSQATSSRVPCQVGITKSRCIMT